MIKSRNRYYELSWSKVNLFLQCPRCFYNDLKLRIKRPTPDPESFKLSKAVDELLKKEFDLYRKHQKPHPIIVENKLDAIPLAHENLERWKDPLYKDGQGGGIRFFNREMNFVAYGGIDDLWINAHNELIIVEYKSTCTDQPVGLHDRNRWHTEYKHQISFYAWLFKKNDYHVHQTGYFIFCNGLKDRSAFNQRLEFELTLLPYMIDDSWVEGTLDKALKCLNQIDAPEPAADCKFCHEYYRALQSIERQRLRDM